MANPEHVALVGQGREAIAEWRRSHPRARLDLTLADLTEADLSGADLTWANLSGASLTVAYLIRADLTGAVLSGAVLSGADLTGADLFGADLFGADLSGANLFGAYLTLDYLTRADLTRADLTLADLADADLSGANLTGADLTEAALTRAYLTGANLTGARLGLTSLSGVDVSQVIGLTTVVHFRPSAIGVDTLMASVRGTGNRLTEELAAFFRGAGVPPELLAALPGIVAEVKYYPCFICYGQPDLAFAESLYKDLKARGVSCWLYAMDAKVGERTWHEIGRKRREAERMVVLCSAKALVRDGVLKEIEEQIDEDPDKMVPISLDDLWKERGFRVARGERDLKPFLLERNYADFANKPYEEALGRLLEGLKREPIAAPEPAPKGLQAAVGAWADFEELDQVVANIYQQREGARDRPAALEE